MPISSPTPEAFLAQPADPEDDLEEESPAEPLESIAESLRRIVDLLALRSSAPDSEDQERVEYITELEDRCVAKQALIDEVLAICKPSTSKLANNIRTVLDPPEPVPEAAKEASGDDSEVCPVHGWTHKFKTCEEVTAEQSAAPAEAPPVPGPDADVWEWRVYALRLGHDSVEVGRMNKSQIRTLVGLPHPGAEAADGSEGTA